MAEAKALAETGGVLCVLTLPGNAVRVFNLSYQLCIECGAPQECSLARDLWQFCNMAVGGWGVHGEWDLYNLKHFVSAAEGTQSQQMDFRNLLILMFL